MRPGCTRGCLRKPRWGVGNVRARIWVEDASGRVRVAREPRLTLRCPLSRQAKREETIVKAEQAIDKFYEDYNAGKERSIKENKSVASHLACFPSHAPLALLR